MCEISESRFQGYDYNEAISYVHGRWPKDVYDCASVWPGDVDYHNEIYGLGMCMIV